jgi:hypothetical protein
MGSVAMSKGKNVLYRKVDTVYTGLASASRFTALVTKLNP